MPSYPKSPRSETVDWYHGIPVPDPYRALEDIESDDVEDWIDEQNAFTEAFLERVPLRNSIRKRMAELLDYERRWVPRRHKKRYFFQSRLKGRHQSALYFSHDLKAEPKLLLDPNELSEKGTVALREWSVSPDGCLVAYGLSTTGSEWLDWRIREVETGLDLSDEIRGVRSYSTIWHPDGTGFFQLRIDKPSHGSLRKEASISSKIYFHSLDSNRADDRLVYERPDHPDWIFDGCSISSCGRYLVIPIWWGCHREKGIVLKDLHNSNAPIIELLVDFDASYQFVGNHESAFYFVTDLDAPYSRLIAIDITRPERGNWKEIIPESEDVLHSACLVGNRFVADYLHDAYHRIAIHALSGAKLSDLGLPGMGTVWGISGEAHEEELIFAYSDFTTPDTLFRFDARTSKTEVIFQRECIADLDGYETKQVFFAGKDGARLSMFLCHRRGITLDGTHPTYIFAHGNLHAISPRFSSPRVLWLELGGILAFANVRGGGEYGAAWYDAGMKQGKQDMVDDLVAASEWLIENNYTCRSKLSIGGWSAGGKLVGATLVQRPDLFGACLPAIGIYDLIRFPKFTVGPALLHNMGSPDDPAEFKFLLGFSPYHNVKPGARYPAVLICASDHDDRCFPGHSYKFAAALQEAQAGDAPILIRIARQAGHIGDKPIGELSDEHADRWTFLAAALDMGSGFAQK